MRIGNNTKTQTASLYCPTPPVGSGPRSVFTSSIKAIFTHQGVGEYAAEPVYGHRSIPVEVSTSFEGDDPESRFAIQLPRGKRALPMTGASFA